MVGYIKSMKLEGIAIRECCNGEEAVQAFTTLHNIVGIILDMQMPVMGGQEACQQIRTIEKERGKRTHIIGVTGEEITMENSLFDRVYQKPVKKSDMVNEIKRWIS